MSSDYGKVISLISQIYYENGKTLPRNYDEYISKDTDFHLVAFATVLETIELMEGE